ncbi:hypothetical protein KBD34_01950 [Patescibacteria group bacterium]|nr:hypothetical protein [Patescibacteria group bacterium]
MILPISCEAAHFVDQKNAYMIALCTTERNRFGKFSTISCFSGFTPFDENRNHFPAHSCRMFSA